ncbi:PREDICTED: putative UPF0481 protein At3g02645 [Nicotiana attenuata]|uniref:Upf0481 protein n=1 Tax=Nicotiana attenuata TaxID=49451 RepID=A0A1J6IKV7_NICAT|nr:PREDICTED: putative UPF0481 protein At3g02645 [Nicotiana attenuata]XP_019266016.1 PREDICTED: putative UPF0481 protein At3g02645 [Nicotiana attenuata]OIT05486.1 upf0481 protein [Nicotiana attenuata]
MNSAIRSTTIFKVSVGLRESNPDAYKPKVISIGPYHKHNSDLGSMEKYKLLYLQRFLRRKEGINVESYIRELEDEALKCYDDIENLESDIVGNFLKILLLDGCFIVELIRELWGMCPEGEGPIKPGSCIINQVLRDLLLVENQLPFFVLTKLHHMTMNKEDDISFTKMVKWVFLHLLPKMTPTSYLESEGNDVAEIKHLLQVVHMSCHPSEIKTTSLTNPSMETQHFWKSLCCNPLQIIRSKDKPIDKDHLTEHKVMPNATELFEAGVSFVKVGYIYNKLNKENLGDNTSLFDIKFENGLMKIPSFKVSDSTETLLRNLIAYEQHSSHVRPRYFSDFAIFMNYLIESEKDVNLLRQKGIIRNWIGEDKEVASLFNRIGKGVIVSFENFYYKEECRKLVQHYEQPWNLMKASLRRNYFNSPWVGASTVAAVILLILTAMQTVLAFTGGV